MTATQCTWNFREFFFSGNFPGTPIFLFLLFSDILEPFGYQEPPLERQSVETSQQNEVKIVPEVSKTSTIEQNPPDTSKADDDSKELNDVENLQSNPEETVEKLKVKDAPELQPYFKMLRLGVPAEAVKLKMSREGLNPSFLDMPDADFDQIKD